MIGLPPPTSDWSQVTFQPDQSPGFCCKPTARRETIESFFGAPLVIVIGDPDLYEAEIDFPDEDLARRFAAFCGEIIVGSRRLRFEPGIVVGKIVRCPMRISPATPARPG